jgi:molybdopterin synthase catalytic subunit
MYVEVRTGPLDPWREVEQLQRRSPELVGKFGATVVFVGTMRDFNEGERVSAMTLEHYPGMTEKHLEKICREALQRWEIQDACVIHRAGTVLPNDPIVLIAVWSAHRAAAFEASRFIIEDLKSKAPFWKKETIQTGERWVETNTPTS